MKILCIDIGNTRTKCAWFTNGNLHSVSIHDGFPDEESVPDTLAGWIMQADAVGVSDAGLKQDAAADNALIRRLPEAKTVRIRPDMKLPFALRYATPHTLGPDRIALAAGAYAKAGRSPLLVLSAGTAFTWEYVDGEPAYRGGGIAPGLRLRLSSLHDQTARLPVAEWDGTLPPLTGDSTLSCLISGAVHGMLAEAEYLIRHYHELSVSAPEVFLCGGDAVSLGKYLKNINFVIPELALWGIESLTRLNLPHAR